MSKDKVKHWELLVVFVFYIYEMSLWWIILSLFFHINQLRDKITLGLGSLNYNNVSFNYNLIIDNWYTIQK
jgi:hypothetical protein